MTAYLDLLEDVERAAKKAGRDPKEIQIVGVSKFCPPEKILKFYEEGLCDFGESRMQEALLKIDQLPSNIRWHFIGPLQKNKVNAAIGKFTLIHSIDTVELAEKISQSSQKRGVATQGLLQVNTSGESTKQGLGEEEWRRNFEKVASLPGLSIKGLMTMAPLTEDSKVIRQTFRKLRLLGEALELPLLSMGMSGDYHIAIEEGANILRIGSKLFR